MLSKRDRKFKLALLESVGSLYKAGQVTADFFKEVLRMCNKWR